MERQERNQHMQKQMGRFKQGGNVASAAAAKLAPGVAQPGSLPDAP